MFRGTNSLNSLFNAAGQERLPSTQTSGEIRTSNRQVQEPPAVNVPVTLRNVPVTLSPTLSANASFENTRPSATVSSPQNTAFEAPTETPFFPSGGGGGGVPSDGENIDPIVKRENIQPKNYFTAKNIIILAIIVTLIGFAYKSSKA